MRHGRGYNVLVMVVVVLVKVLLLLSVEMSEAFSSIRETTTSPATRHADFKNVIRSSKLKQISSQKMSTALQMSKGLTSEEIDDNNETQTTTSTIDKNLEGTSTSTSSINSEIASEGKSNRTLVAGIFLSVLLAASAAAKFGILRGALDLATGELGTYTDMMILRDVGSSILAAALGYVLVKLINLGYSRELYSSKVSRKLSHTLSAPLYMLFFPLFSEADGARFFAACVTLVNAIRLYLAGTGKDANLANAISRSGDKEEVLQGPFIYVCIFQLCILLFWRTSMVGIVAMATMAAGDGMADIVGRRFGKENKWFFSDSKSIAGSVAFVVASSLASIGLVNWLSTFGCLEYTLGPLDLALRIVAISTVCAAVELFPFVDDNYSVPLSAAVLTALLLH